MEHFLPFFITLLAGLVFSVSFKRVQVPWVVSLIFAGIAIGPFGLKLFETDDTVEFISQSGLVLMMFMAGLESKLSSFKGFQSKMYLLSAINGLLPFAVGVLVMTILGYDINAAILVGIIFISSSIAVVIPTLESSGLIKTPLGSSVLATSIVQDVSSLIILSFYLQTEQNIANLPLYVFYPLVIFILIAIRLFLPKLQMILMPRAMDEEDLFQRDLRSVLLILFGMVILFELLGLHAIIAGFFTGLVLSESLSSEILLGKIRAISYGIFIPTFFIVVGLKTDISHLFSADKFLLVTVLITTSSIISKLVSGTLGARLVGFNWSQSSFFGATSIPQLSTTLAATFTGVQLGVLPPEIATAAVVLSIISTIIGPLAMTGLQKFTLSNKDIKKT